MLSESRPLGLIPRCMIFVLTSKVQVLGKNGERLGDLDRRKAMFSFLINFIMGVKINMKHEDHSISLCHSAYETLMENMIKIEDQET